MPVKVNIFANDMKYKVLPVDIYLDLFSVKNKSKSGIENQTLAWLLCILIRKKSFENSIEILNLPPLGI